MSNDNQKKNNAVIRLIRILIQYNNFSKQK